MQNQFKAMEQSLSDINRSFKAFETQRQLLHSQDILPSKPKLKPVFENLITASEERRQVLHSQDILPSKPKLKHVLEQSILDIKRSFKALEKQVQLDIKRSFKAIEKLRLDTQRSFHPRERSISILDTQTSFKAIKQKTQLNTQSKVNIFHRDNFYKLPHNWLYMVRDTIKSLESIEVRYKQLLLGKLGEFARIKNRLYSRKFNLQKQIKRDKNLKNNYQIPIKIKYICSIVNIIEHIEKIIVKLLQFQDKINLINFEYQTETERITQNKIYNSVKQIINKLLFHLYKEQRKYRRCFASIKHINSDDCDKSKHLIITLTVLNSSKRQKITFEFLQLLTAINRLKKDDGEIRNDIPQYWPSSKYRKKRIFEPNHRINCLLFL
ncbi:hypothetical protein WH8501_24350 [Crocosphaera watsonii WH 8501]|uniref:Uncharacterized protein n=1 Tax=Crocosphaera watsonii WH 8501 TaxID=165597 RepID=Q4BXZ1_CROWT|nr:hypothetical protein [Crocosphaera watsonii]EAM48774.1 hypothetical protein CwatDRAFT_1443 [Crocosphaera watsonii WH 8501]